LFRGLQDRLPDGHELANGDPGEFSKKLIETLEPMLFRAAGAEGDTPSLSNLPADGSLIVKHRSDDTGVRKLEYYGRRSFIHDFSRPAVRAIIHNPHIDQSFQLLRSARSRVQF
jgi:hypothetical protein